MLIKLYHKILELKLINKDNKDNKHKLWLKNKMMKKRRNRQLHLLQVLKNLKNQPKLPLKLSKSLLLNNPKQIKNQRKPRKYRK